MQQWWPAWRFDQVLSLGLLAGTVVLAGSASTAQLPHPPKVDFFSPPAAVAQSVALLQPAPIPVSPLAGAQPASISAQSVMVIDVPSASVLWEKNADVAQYPASTTKLMTALVARDIYSPERTLTVKEEAFAQGTIMGLQLGEQITVNNLLLGLLVQSGNDAAFTLANNHLLGYPGFVAALNQKAADLHLTQTHFTNPSGLDEDSHQTSARDLSIIAREVMKDPLLRSIVGTRAVRVTDVEGTQSHWLQTTHELLAADPTVVGIKTGTTDRAGEVLITQVERQGRTVLIVMTSSQNRYDETKRIINWTFNQYVWHDWLPPNS